MNIEELEDKHKRYGLDSNHIKLSIEFAISVLEELHSKNVSYFYFVDAKIQELKTYLNEK